MYGCTCVDALLNAAWRDEVAIDQLGFSVCTITCQRTQAPSMTTVAAVKSAAYCPMTVSSSQTSSEGCSCVMLRQPMILAVEVFTL
jgi:hypothetical protein